MGKYSKPGVYAYETDATNSLPTVSTSSAAIVGYSARGSTDVRLITSTRQFLQEYGAPVQGNWFHYSALAYLTVGNQLYCKRAVSDGSSSGLDAARHAGALIAVDGGTNTTFATDEGPLVATAANGNPDPLTTFEGESGDTTLFDVLAKDTGTWGNSLKIKIVANRLYTASQYAFDIQVFAPNSDGSYSTTPSETFTVSRNVQLDGYGKQMFLEDRINGVSKYIWVINNPDVATVNMVPAAMASALQLGGGSDGTELWVAGEDGHYGAIVTAWDDFTDPNTYPVRILINAGWTAQAVQQAMVTIAEARQDCIAILDVPNYDTVSQIESWRGDGNSVINGVNSSYAAIYGSWQTIYDSYNDQLIDVPGSGYAAARYAYNDNVGYPWDAPAGFDRGRVPTIGSSIIITEADIGTLYDWQINSIVNYRGRGQVIWGQKTSQVKESALSRVNVRRSLIVIETTIKALLENFVFMNNQKARFRINSVLNEYLSGLASQGAFETDIDKGYYVLCNEVNNTPTVIDNNELHVDIFIKPARTAEYIIMQTVVTPTGVAFSELISNGMTI